MNNTKLLAYLRFEADAHRVDGGDERDNPAIKLYLEAYAIEVAWLKAEVARLRAENAGLTSLCRQIVVIEQESDEIALATIGQMAAVIKSVTPPE